jgi:succinate dehydrogenase / fumarate reductase, flavoprotein subunit
MALVSEAVLAALSYYVGRGGGSRGARTVCSLNGDQVPLARTGPLEESRFHSERAKDRSEQILVRLEGDKFICSTRAVRRHGRTQRAFFERDWPAFLTGAIFDRGT